MAKFQIQVGLCKGAFKTRYSFDNPAQASFYYQSLNMGRGYKKRIKVDGKVVAKTSPDMAYCPSRSRRQRSSVATRW